MNNSGILTIKNAKLSGYYFYMNLDIWGDFQICINVPLNLSNHSLLGIIMAKYFKSCSLCLISSFSLLFLRHVSFLMLHCLCLLRFTFTTRPYQCLRKRHMILIMKKNWFFYVICRKWMCQIYRSYDISFVGKYFGWQKN